MTLTNVGSFAYGGIQQAYSFNRFDVTGLGVTTARLRGPDFQVSMVNIKASAANGATVMVYIGGSTVDANNGWGLAPGESTGWIPISNLNLIYFIGSAAGAIKFMYVR